MRKHIIIIGAGISGLSAGIYALRSGFDVTILEQHTIPGGMCTGWKRKGYFFDGSMHWLTGSAPGSALNELWREVGALDDNVKIRYDEPFRSMEWDGQIVSLYRDIDKTQQYFDKLSPEDEKMTERFVADVKAFCKMQMPITDIKGVKTAKSNKIPIGKMIDMIGVLPKMKKASSMSCEDYASQFKHPAIRHLINNLVGGEYSAISLFFTMATLTLGDGGYPEGGSVAMMQRMADTFTKSGGKIKYGIKVDKVITKNGEAVGVNADSALLSADAVIVTQEILAAVEKLFETPPKDEWLAKLKSDTKPANCCFISIGVRTKLDKTPEFKLKTPINCGGFSYTELSLNNYTGFPNYAPEGGTALTTIFSGDSYDFWEKAKEEGRYESEKQAVVEQVTAALVEKYPQIEGKIEVIDVATPITYERYTGASKGSWMSVIGKGAPTMESCPCTLEEIKNVYFAGHRTMPPGGMPVALTSGRAAAQMVCKQFDVVFESEVYK